MLIGNKRNINYLLLESKLILASECMEVTNYLWQMWWNQWYNTMVQIIFPQGTKEYFFFAQADTEFTSEFSFTTNFRQIVPVTWPMIFEWNYNCSCSWQFDDFLHIFVLLSGGSRVKLLWNFITDLRYTLCMCCHHNLLIIILSSSHWLSTFLDSPSL